MKVYIKKRMARVLVWSFRALGIVCGVSARPFLSTERKMSICAPIPELLKTSYPRIQFMMYEFFQKFIQHILQNEKDILFPKKIFDEVVMVLDISQYSQRLFFLFDKYSPAIYNYILKNIEAGDTFFDIGANAGYFSLIASKVVGENGKVYAFEPEEHNFKRMLSNIDVNTIINIYPLKYALSNSDGTAQLYLNPHNEGGHSLVRNSAQRVTSVITIVFDEWVRTVSLTRMRLAKIDVEGFEFSVLRGMEKTLRTENQLELICEVRRDQKTVGDYMSSLGYYTYELDAEGRPIPVKDISKLKRDFLFSKKIYV